MTSITAARTGQSRVFVAEGLAGPKNPPVFQGCLVMGGASQSQGDTTFIYCPDPEQYDGYTVVGEIIGREENVETSISGHFPINQQSNIVRWGRAKTSLAIHVHFGESSSPQDFNTFLKAVIFDNRARITSTDIEDMGTLEESQAIGQSADISAADFYEVVPLNYVTRSNDLVDTEAMGVDVAKIYDESLPLANRFAFYCILDANLVYSLDGGSTFAEVAATAGAVGVGVINDVPVVINDTTGNTYYIDLLNGDSAFTTVVNSQNLNCIASIGNAAYVGGDGGYFGIISDYTSSPTAITLGTADNIISVDALPGGIVVAGTSGGDVFFSVDGINFGTAEIDAASQVTAVCAVNDKIFWAGTAAGDLYFSVNSGQSWAQRNFPGSGSGVVTDIVFPMLSVGWIAHQPAAGDANLLRTVGAGAVGTWYSVPVAGVLPTIRSPKLAVVQGEPNLVLAAGPLDNPATDGVLIVGTGS